MPRVNDIYTVPVGTDGIPNTTISSTAYNRFVHDLESDANAVRPIVAGGTGANTAAKARENLGLSNSLGQCFLALYGGSVTLYPFDGNLITINGVNQIIPDAGVALAPTGLTANTVYNIYAFMSGTAMALEASTVGHIWQPGTGIRIKNGDLTRTLVGKAKTDPGPVWVDSVRKRFVISWFNRANLGLLHNWSAAPSTTSFTHVQLNSAAVLQFLCWPDSTLFVSWYGIVGGDTSGGRVYTTLGIDGLTYQPSQPIWFIPGSNCNFFPVTLSGMFDTSTGISEGYHNTDIYGYVSAGTGFWGVVGMAFPRSSAILLL